MDDYSTYGAYGWVWVLIAGFALFAAVLGAALYVVGSIFMMKVFEKAGVQGKWRAWVPVYREMVFVKLGDLSPWLPLIGLGGAIVLSWIPFLNLFSGLLSLGVGVVMIMAAWRIGLKLQKDAVWVVLYFFLSIVWLGINAFDRSRWNANIGSAPWAGNSFLGDRTVWEGIPAQPSTAAPAGYGAAPAPGYGVGPQGYQAPQGYQTPQGYQAPQDYSQSPAAQSYPSSGNQPVPPASAGVTPPIPPASVPDAPSTPPAPPAAPPAPPAPGSEPTSVETGEQDPGASPGSNTPA